MKLIYIYIVFLFSIFYYNFSKKIVAENLKIHENLEYRIGNQFWQDYFLDKSVFNNGDSIFQARSIKDWIRASQDSIPAWCYFNFNDKDSNNIGKFYNWYVIHDKRDITDNNWRVPNKSDFDSLIYFYKNNIIDINNILLQGNFYSYIGVSSKGEFFGNEKTHISIWGFDEKQNNYNNKYNACSFIYDTTFIIREAIIAYVPKGNGHKIRLIK